MPRINLCKHFHQSIEIYTPSVRLILSHCGANEINNKKRFESLCKSSSTKAAQKLEKVYLNVSHMR